MGGLATAVVFGWGLLSPVGALAQSAVPSPDGEAPKRWVRFLPVGEAPPYRYEYRDGVRYELPPVPGSTPPREIILRTDEEDLGSTLLALGSLSSPLAIPEGQAPIPVYRKKADGVGGEAWYRLRPPESGHFLAILWRDWREGSWEKTMSLLLPDDPARFQAGSVRIVNVSPFQSMIRLAGKDIKLDPGKHVVRPGGRPEGVEFRVLAGDGKGNWLPVYSSGLVQNRGERVNVVIYRADGEKPRRPAKVTVHRELARLPAVPGSRAARGNRP